MELKLKVKLKIAIGKRKALLQNLHSQHRHHLTEAKWCQLTRNAEHFEAHILDMRKLEDDMFDALRQIEIFSTALQKIGLEKPIAGRSMDIIM